MDTQIKYVKVNKTSNILKNKKVKYDGEIVYPNGRHVVAVIVMNGGSHDSHGGYPAEVDLINIEFLFDESLRTIEVITQKPGAQI